MTYAQGSIVLEFDFNEFSDKVNSIFGDLNQGETVEGTADIGYGQGNLVPTVSVGNVINASEWDTLVEVLHDLIYIQGLTPNSLIPQDILSGDIITSYEDAQGLINTLNTLLSNRHNIDPQFLSTSTNGSKLTTSRDFSWSGTVTHEFSATFSNWDEIRYFFNAAGKIIFSGDKSGGGTHSGNTEFENIFSSLGDVLLGRNSTQSNYYTANLGFYSLTDNYQTVHFLSDGNSSYKIEARLNDSPGIANSIEFKVTFDTSSLVDGTLSHYIDETRADSPEISVNGSTYVSSVDFDDAVFNADPVININLTTFINERTCDNAGTIDIQNMYNVATESIILNAVEYFYSTDPIFTNLESIRVKDVVPQGDIVIYRDPLNITQPRTVSFTSGDIDNTIITDTFSFDYKVVDNDTDTHLENHSITVRTWYGKWGFDFKDTYRLQYVDNAPNKTFIQTAIIEPDVPVLNQKFSKSIYHSGFYSQKLFVGTTITPGSVEIYQKNDATGYDRYDWEYVESFSPSNTTGVIQFGDSISVDVVSDAVSDVFYYAFVSDSMNTESPTTNQGAIYPFSWEIGSPSWVEGTKLIPSDTESMDNFGSKIVHSSVTTKDGLQQPLNTVYNVFGNAHNKTDGSFIELGAVYVFSKQVLDYEDPEASSWTEQKLLPTSKESNLHFGYDLDCDSKNEYLICGSNTTSSTGKAYVFKNTTSWAEIQEVVPNDSAVGDQFGIFVSISDQGNYSLVGNGNGDVYIFKNVSDVWTQEAKLSSSDGSPFTSAKFAPSFDNEDTPYIVCSSSSDSEGGVSSGALYIFDRDFILETWEEREKLKPSFSSNNLKMGESLDISYFSDSLEDNTIYAGGIGYDTQSVQDCGGVFVFDNTIGDPAPTPISSGIQSGKSISIADDESRFVISSLNRDENGSVYVFDKDVTIYKQSSEHNLPITPSEHMQFGFSVSISGDGSTFVATTPNGSDVGEAYVFEYDGELWDRIKLPSPTLLTGSRFGEYCEISKDGNVIVVGAPKHHTDGVIESGAAFVYVKNSGIWELETELHGFTGSKETASITDSVVANENFGNDVSISGKNNEFIYIGNKNYQSLYTNSGSVCVYSNIGETTYEPYQQLEIPSGDNANGVEFGYRIKVPPESQDLFVVASNNSLNKNSAVYIYRLGNTGYYSSSADQKIDGLSDPSGGNLYTDINSSHDGREIYITENGRNSTNRSADTHVYYREGTASSWTNVQKLDAIEFHGLDELEEINKPVIAVSKSQTILVGSPQETKDGETLPQGGYFHHNLSLNDIEFLIPNTNNIDNVLNGDVAVTMRSIITNHKVYFTDSNGVKTEYLYSGNILSFNTDIGKFTFDKTSLPVSIEWDASSGFVAGVGTGILEYSVTNDIGETEEEIHYIELQPAIPVVSLCDFFTEVQDISPYVHLTLNDNSTSLGGGLRDAGGNTVELGITNGTPVFSESPLISSSNNTGNSMRLPDGDSTRLGTTNFSLSSVSVVSTIFWFKQESPGTVEVPLSINVSGGSTGFTVEINTSGTAIKVGGRSQSGDSLQQVVWSGTLTPGDTYFVYAALDYGNDMAYISINAAPIESASVSFGSSTFTNGSELRIGADVADLNHYSGYLDQIVLDTKLYSQGQINNLYGHGTDACLFCKYEDEVFLLSPNLWYKFNGTNDTEMLTNYGSQTGGGTNNGMTITQDPLVTQSTQSYESDSVTDYIDLGWNAVMNGSNAVSFVSWIKPNNIGTPVKGRLIWMETNSLSQTGFTVFINASGNAAVEGKPNSGQSQFTLTGSDILANGNIYMVYGAIDYENDRLYLSVNGGIIEELSASWTATTVSFGGQNSLMNYKHSPDIFNSLQGKMDQPAMWRNRLLTQDELADLYNKGVNNCAPLPAWDDLMSSIGPDVWYKMDDASGVLIDSGSAGNDLTSAPPNLTYMQPPLVQNGTGNSILFADSGEDGVNLNSLANGSSQISFFTWVKPDDVSGAHYFFSLEGSVHANNSCWGRLNVGTAQFFGRPVAGDTANVVASPTSISTGQTYFIYADVDFVTGETRISVNGEPFTIVNTSFSQTTFNGGDQPWLFAQHPQRGPTQAIQGTLDEMGFIFDNKLSIEQVQQLYQSGIDVCCWDALISNINPLTWWKCDGTGSSVFSDSGTGSNDNTYSGSSSEQQPPLLVGSVDSFRSTSVNMNPNNLLADLDGSSQVAFMCWFRADDALDMQRLFLFETDNTEDATGMSCYIDSGQIKAWAKSTDIDTKVEVTSPMTLTSNQIYFVYCDFDFSTGDQRISINGEPFTIAVNSYGSSVFNAGDESSFLYSGSQFIGITSPEHFVGYIDEVVWLKNNNLSHVEVQELYNSGI